MEAELPREWDGEPWAQGSSEPLSPDSPIKTLVRRASKSRPSEKVIHRFQGYNGSVGEDSGSSSLMLRRTVSAEEADTRCPSAGEIGGMNRDATNWFRKARSINQEATAEEKKRTPTIVRRRSTSVVCQAPALSANYPNATLQDDVPEDIDKVVAKKMSPEEREAVKKIFDEYDIDGSGTIDLQELTAMCSQLGGCITRDEAKMLMNQLDKDNSGTIDFNEFLWFWKTQPSLGKYRSIACHENASGMHALMGGLLKTTTVAITKNTLLSRLHKGKEGLRRRATIE